MLFIFFYGFNTQYFKLQLQRKNTHVRTAVLIFNHLHPQQLKVMIGIGHRRFRILTRFYRLLMLQAT